MTGHEAQWLIRCRYAVLWRGIVLMFSMSVCLTIFNSKHSVGLVECLPSVHEVLGSVPSTAKANRTNYVKFRAQWSALYTPFCNCLPPEEAAVQSVKFRAQGSALYTPSSSCFPPEKAVVQSHETLIAELVWGPRCPLDLHSRALGAAQGLTTREMTVRIAL